MRGLNFLLLVVYSVAAGLSVALMYLEPTLIWFYVLIALPCALGASLCFDLNKRHNSTYRRNIHGR